jgi:signal transduction histidine kinase
MALPTLEEVVETHKEEIFQKVTSRLAGFPWSSYRQFLIHTEEGQRRLRIFVELFSRALRGDREAFLKDQQRVGYMRATMEGFGPETLTQFYSSVPRIIWSTMKKKLEDGGVEPPGLCEEVLELNDVLFHGYSRIMASYLRVREERISEQVHRVQEVQQFTEKIIALLELEPLVAFVLRRMSALFGAEEGVFKLYRDHRVHAVYRHPAGSQVAGEQCLIERTHREKAVLFLDPEGKVFSDIGERELKSVVSAPVHAHGRVHGVLCLQRRDEGFPFGDKELEFLNQFLYITALALENAFMLKEVEQARESLRLLTGKMITIQEEERRRLAADIHDTLTQALIGISYKIQLCKELADREPDGVAAQMDKLLIKIDEAIDQSRNLISSLRPDLIDTMGLVPALERHVEGFSRETGIRVTTRFSEHLELPSEVNLCLFRVAQEALMNIYKHAQTNEAEMSLGTRNGEILFTVLDRGKGFVWASEIPPAGEKSRLGLLSMKERIQSIGGRVRIEAEIGQGCSIQVTIPYRRGQGRDGQDQGDDR